MKKIIFFLMVLAVTGCATPKQETFQSVFFPPLPQTPKLQFLLSISDETDIGKKPGGLAEYLYGEMAAKKRLGRPIGITSVKGRIYVSDKQYNKILSVDLENKDLNFVKDEGAGTIDIPFGIWATEDGYKYVADIGRNQVLVYDNNDKYIKAYGDSDIFGRPLDVAVYQNKVYVVDQKKSIIYVFDKDSGKVIQEIGGVVGKGDGEFYRPSYLTVDTEGNLYVGDSFNFRVQVFDPEGKFVKTFGKAGDTLGSFARPKGIAIDRDKHIYAVDTAFENVQIFDVNSTDLLLFFGGFETGPGSMHMPHGIHIDYENTEYFKKYADKNFKIEYLVYVGNTLGFRKLNVYGFGEWIGPALPKMRQK